MGKPKIQPSAVVTPHHNSSALLPYLMLNFLNYSPVSQVMFFLLSEHSGSESAAFLGAAALGVFLPSGDGDREGAWIPSALPALGKSLAAGRTVGLLLQVEVLSSLIASCCIYLLEFVK